MAGHDAQVERLNTRDRAIRQSPWRSSGQLHTRPVAPCSETAGLRGDPSRQVQPYLIWRKRACAPQRSKLSLEAVALSGESTLPLQRDKLSLEPARAIPAEAGLQ